MVAKLPLDQMTVTEKWEALEAIWASLCNKPVDVTSPQWHQQVLSERKRRLESGEATVSDWTEAKQRLRELGR